LCLCESGAYSVFTNIQHCGYGIPGYILYFLGIRDTKNTEALNYEIALWLKRDRWRGIVSVHATVYNNSQTEVTKLNSAAAARLWENARHDREAILCIEKPLKI